MQRTVSLPVVVVCLLVPAVHALPAPGLLGDAGSGVDAGGTPETAMPLAYGEYHGNMTLGDSDWFVFPAFASPACMRTSVLAKHAMTIEVGAGEGALEGGLTDGMFATTVAVEPVATRLGLLPDDPPWDGASVGPYAFNMEVALPTAVGDSRFADAQPSLSGALPAPADCFAAHFKKDGPDVDAWSFTAEANDRLTYSIAIGPDAIGGLTIHDVNDTMLGDPVGSGEVGQLIIPSSGTYYLRATSLSSIDDEAYTVAAVAGPEPTSCRPYCLA